jgi:hypothetical protein
MALQQALFIETAPNTRRAQTRNQFNPARRR